MAKLRWKRRTVPDSSGGRPRARIRARVDARVDTCSSPAHATERVGERERERERERGGWEKEGFRGAAGPSIQRLSRNVDIDHVNVVSRLSCVHAVALRSASRDSGLLTVARGQKKPCN